jgi:hypothetical protein
VQSSINLNDSIINESNSTIVHEERRAKSSLGEHPVNRMRKKIVGAAKATNNSNQLMML